MEEWEGRKMAISGFAGMLMGMILVVLALWFAPEACAKMPAAKYNSCENKVIFVAQVFHAKQQGRTLEWVIDSVTEAQKQFPDVDLNELLVQVRWVYTYRGSELSAEEDFYNRCTNPLKL